MRLHLRDLIFPVVIICCALSVSYMTVCQAISDRKSLYRRPKNSLLSTTQRAALGSHPTYLGSPDATYTLIEFADYQCPPCRNVDSQLKTLVSKYAGRLRVTFRNFPLTELHPEARTAAIAAEAARLQGRFWPVHDALYAQQEKISDETIYITVRSNRLDLKKFEQAVHSQAVAAVNEDIAFGNSIGINGTPSFLLCCPDGRVFKMSDLDQIPTYLKP